MLCRPGLLVELVPKAADFSEVQFMGSLEEDHLKRVRARAQELGIEVEMGMRSICPSSRMFDKAQGTAEEQLTRMVVAARTVGSPIVRAVLDVGGLHGRGSHRGPDREHGQGAAQLPQPYSGRGAEGRHREPRGGPPGFGAEGSHRSGRQGVRRILPRLGHSVVDLGGPARHTRDPGAGPVTSHLRDSYVWRVPEGERSVRSGSAKATSASRITCASSSSFCPGRALSHEVIVMQQRPTRIFSTPNSGEPYQKVRASEFVRFLALAEAGKPLPALPQVAREAAAQKQREDLEVSIANFREFLKGLG